MGSRRFGLSFALSAFMALGAKELSAQARIISLAATSPADLSLVITSGAIQTIAGVTDNAVNSFPSPVVLQTTWSVNPGQTNTVNLVAYFMVPAQALVGGTTQIPSSRILARMSTGLPTAFTPVTQNAFAGVGTAKAFCVTGVNAVGSPVDIRAKIRLDGICVVPPTSACAGTMK